MTKTNPMCPRLSRLNPPSPLDPKGQSTLQIVPCQGPACAIFVMEYDDVGKPTGQGQCAETLNAVAQARIMISLEAIQAEVCGDDDDDEEDDPKPPADEPARA